MLTSYQQRSNTKASNGPRSFGGPLVRSSPDQHLMDQTDAIRQRSNVVGGVRTNGLASSIDGSSKS